MKHTVEDLLGIVLDYYPRGIPLADPRYKASAEHHRLVAARRRAGTEKATWNALLEQLNRQFPADGLLNDSLHLPLGTMDAAYSGKLFPAGSTENLTLGFLVSFLVPYYVVYTLRSVPDLERMAAPRAKLRFVFEGDTCYAFSADPNAPEEAVAPFNPTRELLHFNFSPDEQAYATWIASEIEASWGYERMPPEVGRLIVPDVATDHRGIGEATVYDCLMSDNAFVDPWIR